MTAKDLQTLSRYLFNLSVQELYQLDYTFMLSFGRLGGKAQHLALSEILYYLQVTEPYRTRISYVAWIYCFLMPRSRIGPWRLYKVENFEGHFRHFDLHWHFAQAMQYPGSDMTFLPVVNTDTRLACVITTDPEFGLLEHGVLGVCVFNKLPYVALWIGGAVNVGVLDSALKSVLKNNPQQCLVSVYTTLDSTHAAARHLFHRKGGQQALEAASARVHEAAGL
ncbi:hypothetical protein MRX96_057158 [Rhipicephalus microplus]|uniref:Uncharacterized protein n=1 Tax=Rhipicephalus microplus TaxID=6941 RepID=A0A9J6EIV4_RHIMP|nr:hypothetical protein HPB51_022092 [Rhipicephalus microplus]